MNPLYQALVAVALVGAALASGFFWGKAVTEKQVRIEYRDAPATALKPGAVIKCTAKPLNILTTKSSTPTNTETTLTVELPSQPLDQPLAVEVGRPLMPAWRITGMAGYDFRAGMWTGGAMIEHHIFGPFYGGAFGLSSGVAGISISATF